MRGIFRGVAKDAYDAILAAHRAVPVGVGLARFACTLPIPAILAEGGFEPGAAMHMGTATARRTSGSHEGST